MGKYKIHGEIWDLSFIPRRGPHAAGRKTAVGLINKFQPRGFAFTPISDWGILAEAPNGSKYTIWWTQNKVQKNETAVMFYGLIEASKEFEEAVDDEFDPIDDGDEFP